jgi:putative membrane protein
MSGMLGSRWVRVLVVALVPLLAVGVLVWSTTGRSDKIDRIPVAIVNNDKIITGSQPMAAGRSLSAALTEPKDPDQNLDWTLTDQDDATSGLRNGTYYAVLTIPTDFSQSILSTGTDKPFQGKLSLVSNSAASVTVPYISQQVTASAADALGVQSTRGYLKNVYGGFNQLASSNKKAASSASSLADGTGQLFQGAKQLDGGTSQLAGSLDQVQSGASALQAGTANLATGAAGVRTGAAGVASGAHKLHTGTEDLAASSGRLARSSRDVAAASRKVAQGAGKLARANGALTRLDQLLHNRLDALARDCTAAGGSTVYCDRVALVARGAGANARIAAAVGHRSDALAGSTRKLSSATGRVAQGNAKLSAAARRLDRASADLSSGADELLTGATSVASGAGTVDRSAGSLATGTQETAAAGASLASGASSLSSSAGQVDSGADQLSSGLAKGAKESPTYSDSQQTTLEKVVSQPVLMAHSLQNDKHGNGWMLALVIGLVLWMAALLGALRRDVSGAARYGALPVSTSRLVLSELLPALGLAVVEGLAVLAALLALRVSTASFLPFAFLTLVAALTFTAIAYAVRLMFRRAGLPVLVLFLLVQAAALGNVVPLETAPGPLRTLNAMLPLTTYVDGASQLVTGGHVQSPVRVLAVLLAWGLAACLAAVLTVGRRRVSPRVEPAAVAAGGAVA